MANNTDTLEDRDNIYNHKVLLFEENLERNLTPHFMYTLMGILQKSEKEILLLLNKTFMYHKVVVYEGSYEACETVVDSLEELGLISRIIS